MFTSISNTQSHVTSTDSVLPLAQYTRLLYLFLFACGVLILIIVFSLKAVAREVAIVSAIPYTPFQQTTPAANDLQNTTPTQALYLNPEQKNEVTVNDQTIPLPQEGEVHVTVPLPGGQATVDSRSHSTQSRDGSSVTSSQVEIHATNSSEIVIEDTQ